MPESSGMSPRVAFAGRPWSPRRARTRRSPCWPTSAAKAPAYREDDRWGAFRAEQNALVVKDAEAYYRAMVRGGPESWNIRDRHMQETLERLARFYGPESRGIVWEHNTHIGDARFTDMAGDGMVNVGQLARERWGEEDAVLVGFATHRGSVIAGRAWDAPAERMDVPEAREGSLGRPAAPGGRGGQAPAASTADGPLGESRAASGPSAWSTTPSTSTWQLRPDGPVPPLRRAALHRRDPGPAPAAGGHRAPRGDPGDLPVGPVKPARAGPDSAAATGPGGIAPGPWPCRPGSGCDPR